MFRLLVNGEFTFHGVYSNYAEAAAAIAAAQDEFPGATCEVQTLESHGDTSEWVLATDPEAPVEPVDE